MPKSVVVLVGVLFQTEVSQANEDRMMTEFVLLTGTAVKSHTHFF